MASPFFELENITKYFSKVVANRNVNLSVEKGEVLALLGENGAGKSTLMKILYGLYRAEKEITVSDAISHLLREPFDYTKWRRDNLYDDMSLHELNQKAAQYAKDHPFKKCV